MLRSYRYEEIAQDLRKQILRGDFAAQRRLPSGRRLMLRYDVQRNTIRQALALLESEGHVVVEPKRGAFAAPSLPSAPPAVVEGPAPPHDIGGDTEAASGVILVINPWNSSSTALDGVLYGLPQALEGSGLSLQRFDSRPAPGQALYRTPTPDYLAAHQVVGAVLWPQSAADPEALRRLREAVPLVLIDRRVPGLEADYVRFDDIAGGRMVTEHLLQQGHRRIGFLGDEIFAETVQHRWRGYTLALTAAGIEPDPSWLALFHGIKDPPFSDHAEIFLAGGGDPLTAVVCSNDSTALLLLRFLRATGRRVPEDVAVTGYGNLLPDYLDALELTTVSQPFDELGRTVGRILVDQVKHREAASPRQIELPVRLIIRESSVASRVK